MHDKTIQLAYDLCAISSISGQETAALEFLSASLTALGMSVTALAVDDHRYNIFATFAHREKFSAIFCTHIDTVAPFIAPTLSEDALWGRGACDAKGIIAAMVSAIKAQHNKGFDDMALLITVGEEEASDGAKACHDSLKDRAHCLVVGEPTELKAAYGQKGCLVFDLKAHGIEAHSSTPHLGDSALHKLMNVCHNLISYPWPTHDDYGETLLNIGEFAGGTMRNVLAKTAVAKAMMRLAQPADELIAIVQTKLSEGIEMQIHSKTDPALYAVPAGFATFLAGFGTDAPYLKNVANKTMLVGPGSLDLAHKVDEHIYFSQLHDGVRAYEEIALQLRQG